MVVTHLALELCFQRNKLRGFTCKLTRSAHGVLPESSWTIAGQVLLPYLVSGLGMVAAGIVMDIVQVWKEKCDCAWEITLLFFNVERVLIRRMNIAWGSVTVSVRCVSFRQIQRKDGVTFMLYICHLFILGVKTTSEKTSIKKKHLYGEFGLRKVTYNHIKKEIYLNNLT